MGFIKKAINWHSEAKCLVFLPLKYKPSWAFYGNTLIIHSSVNCKLKGMRIRIAKERGFKYGFVLTKLKINE